MSHQEPAVPTGRFDYIIVGAGTAGCLLANRLSSDPRIRVLLLEAGADRWRFWVQVPLGIYRTIGDPATDWCFSTEPEPALNGRRIPVPRGLGVGGSSLINGMVYVRGRPADYDGWRDMGNPGWGFSDLLPVFKRHEDFHGGASERHGAGGEWRVEPIAARWQILDRFAQAASKIGIPQVSDVNTCDGDCFSYFHVNCRSGVRVSARSAFLNPVRRRDNLVVLSDSHARRVLLQGSRAVGVEFWRNGQLHRADAHGEVLVASGAIGSPQLLQASGIGAPEVLRAAGVPLAHELAGVGENLQDHVGTRMVLKVHGAATLNRRARSAVGRFGIGLQYLLARSGPLAAPGTLLCGFARSSPEHTSPNLQYHVLPMSTTKFGGDFHPFDGMTASFCNLKPTSRGHVRVRTQDTRDHPAVLGNFLSTGEDQKVAVEAMKLTRRICQADPLRPHQLEEVAPGTKILSDAQLLEHARSTAIATYHPVGTCRMGGDRAAVVDARLRVHGLHGLRVIDASIMPTLISGNTGAACLAIAEKGADMVLEDRLNRTEADRSRAPHLAEIE